MDILTYAQQQAYDTVERIVAEGWEFKAYSYTPQVKGWWIKNDGDTSHEMRRGDPKEVYEGARLVAELYLDNEPETITL